MENEGVGAKKVHAGLWQRNIIHLGFLPLWEKLSFENNKHTKQKMQKQAMSIVGSQLSQESDSWAL